MNELEQIDSLFTESRKKLNAIIESFDFEIQFDFVLNENIDFNMLGSVNFSGIYRIDIRIPEKYNDLRKWISDFSDLWEAPVYKPHFVPNTKIKRINAHCEMVEWFPLYIGKAKSIKRRIKEHIELKLGRPTTALKLLERKNLYGNQFRISTIKIEVVNYDLIASEFENSFREKINPILGRK